MAKKQKKAKSEFQKEEVTRALIQATVISSLGSAQYGYNLWVINHPLVFRQSLQSLNMTKLKEIEDDPPSEFLGFLMGLTIYIFPFGGLVGSLLVGPLVDICGRKDTLLLNNFLSLISAILMGFTAVIIDYEFMLFSRLFCGICAGIFSCTVPMYVGEIAPEDIRGATTVVPMLFVETGALLAQIVGHPQILGSEKDSSILLGLSGVLAVMAIFLFPFIPESPRYLLLQKRDEEKAMAVLKKLRDQEDVEDEMQDLYQEDISERGEKNMNVLKLIRFRAMRWQVLSIIILMMGQQLSGIHMAYVFMEKVDQLIAVQNYQIEVVGIATLLAAILSLMILINIIDSMGRRLPLLIGYGIITILSILLTMSIELEVTFLQQGTISWMTYLSTIFLFIFIFGHVMGPGSIPSVLMVELFLQSSRSSAFVIGGFVQWLLNFLMISLAFYMAPLGSYIFLVFWPVCAFTFMYSMKVIPETQQKSFVTIKRLMALYMARKIMVQKPPAKGQFKPMQEITEDKESEIVEEEEKREFTRPVILATVISSIGFLQYGYNFWVLHFPAVILMNFHNATDEKKRDFNILHQSILFFFFFVAIALYPLGGFIGSFIFAPLADTCGRKQTLLINSFFSMTCAILMGFSKMAAAYEFSMFSRFITGVSSGICYNIVPVYITEIAPKNRRGAMHVVASFFLLLGILLGQVFTAPQLLGNEKGWPILMGFAGFIALFQILPLFYVPESPRYLLMQNGDEEKARQVLRKLTGQDDVEEEMEDLQMEDHAERTEKNMTVFKLIRFPGPQRRFAIIFVLMFAQQFTGYSAVRNAYPTLLEQ
ncbi:hypothetical protein lerEdw1_003123 [Lerista edwardsae]|nr:hypothetical protein lerEdw1_003123 [Lerista edwardsae]